MKPSTGAPGREGTMKLKRVIGRRQLPVDTMLKPRISGARFSLREGAFLVGTVDLAQSVTNLTYGSVSFYGVDDEGHRVHWRDLAVGGGLRLLCSGFLQRVETAADFIVRAASTQLRELLALMAGDRLVDIEDVG